MKKAEGHILQSGEITGEFRFDKGSFTVKQEDMLVFAYPVQYSTAPKILRDFISDNKELWKNKRVLCVIGA